MPIDPDVQAMLDIIDARDAEQAVDIIGLESLVDQLTARVVALESAPIADDGIQTFGPGSTAADINNALRLLWHNEGGGKVRLDGHIQLEGPIYQQPGCELFGVGTPMMFARSRTSLEPLGSFPAIVLDDGKEWGKREAWGNSYTHDLQIHCTQPGVTAIFHRGGNNQKVHDIFSSYGTEPLAHSVLVDMDFPGDPTQAQWGNGDYCDFRRLKFTRAHVGAEIIRNAPDPTFTQCTFYGTSSVGSKGLIIHQGANNNNFIETHFQKWDEAINIDSWENTIYRGSWEPKSASTNAWASYAVRFGPNSRGNTVESLSFAQVSKVQNAFVFDAGARDFAIVYPRGEIGNLYAHVPAGFEDHFLWLPV